MQNFGNRKPGGAETYTNHWAWKSRQFELQCIP